MRPRELLTKRASRAKPEGDEVGDGERLKADTEAHTLQFIASAEAQRYYGKKQEMEEREDRSR